MTVEELRQLVESITFCGGLKMWGARMTVSRSLDSDIVSVLMVFDRVPHRDTDEPINVYSRVVFDMKDLLPISRAQVLALLRPGILGFVEHEVCESVLVDGNRVWDPHRMELLLHKR
jgi:hypothetical protein